VLYKKLRVVTQAKMFVMLKFL